MGEAVNPWLHILAATIWVGPQVFLFAAAVPAIRTIEDAKARATVMRVMTRRFGFLAWSAMAVLVITGIGNVYEVDHVGCDSDCLFDLNWGTIFEVKMTLVIATVVLTALHSFVLGPRLMAMQESVTDEAQIASMRRLSIITSAVNALLALAIVFCAALMNTTFALE